MMRKGLAGMGFTAPISSISADKAAAFAALTVEVEMFKAQKLADIGKKKGR